MGLGFLGEVLLGLKTASHGVARSFESGKPRV